MTEQGYYEIEDRYRQQRSVERPRQITLLLTRHHDPFSNYICRVSKSTYSHASLSIDPGQNEFYSFNRKGFVIEYPKNRKRKSESMSICIWVSGAVYERLKMEIEHFLEQRKSYHYALLGAFCCSIHIPVRFKNWYFCSQFVAEILERAGVATLKKKSELYLPNHLIDDLEYHFPVWRSVCQPVCRYGRVRCQRSIQAGICLGR